MYDSNDINQYFPQTQFKHANEQSQHQRDSIAPLQQTPTKADLRGDARRGGGGSGNSGGGGGGGGNSATSGSGGYSSNHKRRSRIHDLPMPPMGKDDDELSPPPDNDSNSVSVKTISAILCDY